MRTDIKAIAWDFDGVLNRNVVDGRFVWADALEEDFGISPEEFQSGIFNSTFTHVISGKADLKDHVQNWLDQAGHAFNASVLIDYWFEKDDLKDPYTCGLVDEIRSLGVEQIIATNNEDRRASYIEDTTGFLCLVSRIFSSGRIGHAKPDTGFFNHVSDTLGLPPGDILLIDDSAANVRAAEALGWKGFHFTGKTRFDLAPFLGL
ncbi:HAD family hydrolase [Roseibium sp. Sym1]|uniref:HAD family hydrolase n=1 Tax=Roseibium sp. Sym1 TaxID=3016006 RepID=UPI0022B2CAB7|nr:HAD-IA family hydrolase [Roseibium sp. Sym1]